MEGGIKLRKRVKRPRVTPRKFVEPKLMDEEEARVIFADFRNRKVIKCQRECGQEINVWVSDSENYHHVMVNGDPMMVRVRFESDGWRATGKAPRYPGRW